MGVRYLAISAGCTVLSFLGLQFGTELSLGKSLSTIFFEQTIFQSESASQLLLASSTTAGLLAFFVVNIFILLILCLKTIFFVELYSSETRKLVERLVNYIIYKGLFLPLVVPPTIFQAGLWSTWLTVLCSLKMFQALSRDRLERLNTSPSATPLTYFRVYSVLLLVLAVDFFWIRLCLVISRTLDSSMFLLLFLEPFSIAFETLQAIVVHGFQLLDIWLPQLGVNDGNCQRSKFFDTSAAGSFWEWKGILVRNMGFLLDLGTLLMALGHYLHIWWLHGMAFHLVDVVLFLNIRALLSAIVKRIKGFIRLRVALGTLHAAFPDATTEELLAYDDECAICREPMAKAKKLNCKHQFHLACLRSWLDQGSIETYSCPTCRKPLFVGRPENEASPHTEEDFNDEQLPHQISAILDRQTNIRHPFPLGAFSNQTQNPLEGDAWRGAGFEPTWFQDWPNQGLDGAGPSTSIGPVGLGRVQTMMRHLASVGETYAQTALEDSSWSLWPMNPSQAAASALQIPLAAGGRYPGGTAGLHIRNASRSADDNFANILIMADTVREVLPHIPDEIILQDLQRTNSATVTVNNLLQM